MPKVSAGTAALAGDQPLQGGPVDRCLFALCLGFVGESVVVGLAGEDLVRPVELLEEHDARELVGEGHRAERQPLVDARRSSMPPNGPPITKHRSQAARARRSSRKR